MVRKINMININLASTTSLIIPPTFAEKQMRIAEMQAREEHSAYLHIQHLEELGVEFATEKQIKKRKTKQSDKCLCVSDDFETLRPSKRLSHLYACGLNDVLLKIDAENSAKILEQDFTEHDVDKVNI
jgi:hypothetical protein